MRTLKKERELERGAVLPIAAIMALALLGFLTALAVDSYVVKDAQRRFRSGVDSICKQVALEATNQERAFSLFAAKIKLLAGSDSGGYLRRTTITSARLLIPITPDIQVDENGRDSIDSGYLRAPSFDSLIEENTDNPQCSESPDGVSSLCFIGHISTSALQHAGPIRRPYSLFPIETLINENMRGIARNAGMIAGCEVVAEVKPLFKIGEALSTLAMKVKALWWTPVRAMHGDGRTLGWPGLSIAIGTQMRADAGQRLFRFDKEVNRQALYDSNFETHFDPLFRAKGRINEELPFRGGAPQTFRGMVEGQMVTMQLRQSYVYDKLLAEKEDPQSPYLVVSELDNRSMRSPIFFENIVASCVNPPAMVRNALLSTIVELAARHGQLRDSTEILSMNSMSLGKITPPATITELGQDLMLKNYQIPFVSGYHDFGRGAEWINPFLSDPPQVAPFQELMRMYAQQLRYCLDLYTRESESVGYLQRFTNDAQDRLFRNSFGSAEAEARALQTRFRSVGIVRPSHTWDQYQSWNAAASEGITAAQVVSVLGSTTLCPREVDHDGTSVCTAQQAAQSLAPDINTTARYLSGDSMTASDDFTITDETPIRPVPAVVSPGLFPLGSSITRNSSLPFDAARYTSAKSVDTHVLIVTHTLPPLTAASPFIQIVNRMALGPRPRPVTIVFIPTNRADLAQVNTLRSLLTPTDSNGVPVSQMLPPTLILLAPPETPGEQLEDSDFMRYWHRLLTAREGDAGVGQNIVRIAESIFKEQLLRLELRY